MTYPADVDGAVARSHAACSWNCGFGPVQSQYAVGHARLLRMKEDVLEQIVDDYLQMQGYFTTHNVRFNFLPCSVPGGLTGGLVTVID